VSGTGATGAAAGFLGGPALGDDFITGEAVPLDLRIAQLPSRALAIVVDLLVQYLLILGAAWLLTRVASHADSATVAGFVVVVLVLIVIGYPVMFETFTRGRSLGKMAVGLRVVRDDGGAERFRHALVRGLFELPEIWLTAGTIAALVSLLNERGKRFGDFAAGTVVVRERTPRNKSTWEPRVTPALAPWAAVVDLSRVPDDLALALRQFLARMQTLSPQARAELSQRLLADTLRFIAPPPPPAYADEILAAVVAERRRREELRMGARPTYGPATPAPYAPAPYPPPATYVPPAPVLPQATPPPTDGGFQAPR
jgi:uncharacterized RDD family membrane protein YckC